MSRTPRFVPPSSTGALVEVTYRTIQGRFLLRPDRELNELVVGVLARAQSFCNAELIGIVVLSNHLHLLLWVENQWHLSKLMEHFGGNTAREVNRLQDWRGSLWERRYTGIYVTEEASAQIERLSYILLQGLKEDLVERVENWPGIHFGKYLLEGRSLLAGKWVDRTKKYRLEMQRRGKEKDEAKEVTPDEYTTTLTVELKPLPCLEHLGWGGYIRFVTELIRDAEREAAESRKQRGVGVVGREEICRHDPQMRPNRVKRSPAPQVHAASKKAREEWREAFGMFLLAYREAAKLLKKGVKDAPFPEGCFPPGLPFVGDTGEATRPPG
jgi:REP element-mobilizing transposase RayT